jgi:hypothetical protein
MANVEDDRCYFNGNQIERIKEKRIRLLPWQEVIGTLRELSQLEDFLLVKIDDNFLRIDSRELDSKDINFLYNCIERKIGVLKTDNTILIRVI